MSVFISKEGVLTTIQDLGRTGFRRYGVNPGGAMDRCAALLLNTLLGNRINAPVLELHYPAGEITFDRTTDIALGGADFEATLDGKKVSNWKPVRADPESILRFPAKVAGNRAYLAVRGGFCVGHWLGSSSTNLTVGRGGLNGRRLRKGDIIETGKTHDRAVPSTTLISTSLLPRYSRFPTVRVIVGAEFDLLTKESRQDFAARDFVITNNSDRMGFLLRGDPLKLQSPIEMLSSAVNFGTIQLLPDGQLVVLMADHQTSGGYPRVAHVIERDLPLLAQLGPNDKVAFHLIDLAAAEELSLKFDHELRLLRTGVALMSGTQNKL